MAGGVVSCGGSDGGASSGGEIQWLSYHPSMMFHHLPAYSGISNKTHEYPLQVRGYICGVAAFRRL
jgi:hypothetical protein